MNRWPATVGPRSPPTCRPPSKGEFRCAICSARVGWSRDEAEAIQVNVDNAASQFFSVVEVRAPDQVGLLYRIARALHELGLDIHHAKIATYPEGALDVFYVRDLSGEKLDEPAAQQAASDLAAWLRGAQTPG